MAVPSHWKKGTEKGGPRCFDIRDQGTPGYFIIETSEQESSLRTTPVSHLYFLYEQKGRKIISSGFFLKETTIPPWTVLVVHGYFQNVGVG